MTYRELLKHLSGFTPEQMDQNVTVLCGDEYLPMNHIGLAEDDDVLDDDHIVLMNVLDQAICVHCDDSHDLDADHECKEGE